MNEVHMSVSLEQEDIIKLYDILKSDKSLW